ncbi:sigma-70 family RNA polymerase sigma factor [Zobellia alginiliquefaciens]|uniref:sigma-70 family RNA polymerase sigma factor n=1 Tax=Zobellia alginiliquefaciens TaxID=3032586 RepID=UPI0023E471C5|nr:sigma-70 family RNA polymerase sigma factor [Zobellia alginiliquefaciens]
MEEDNTYYSLLNEQVKASNHAAYIKLFNILWEPMYIYARALLADEDLAKDLLQNIWSIYWEKRENIEARNIKVYLFSSLRNECYRHLSKQDNFKKVQLDEVQLLQTEEGKRLETTYEELVYSIHESLKTLPARCKEIFVLSRLNGFTNDQIAINLNISKRTVENQLSTALKKVRKDLLLLVRIFV